MSTPPAQNVPSSFQNTIPLPPDQDPAAVDASANQVSQYQRYADLYNTELTQYQAKIKAAKGNTAKVDWYNSQVKNIQAEQAKNTASLNAAQQTANDLSGNWQNLLQGDQRDAYAALESQFSQYGLGDLASTIFGYVQQGYGADTITLLLQDTPQYKQRFAGNAARAKAGLPVLSPADYLSTEDSYRQILQNAGLPSGFYDNPADFTSWISSDVSPTEIQDRVNLAEQAVDSTDPTYRNALYQMYGINSSDLAAYFLDQKTAEPILKKQAAAGAIGAAALRRGFSVNRLDMEAYADLGITADQAEQAYGTIADSFNTMLGLAGRFGTTWDQQQAEQAVFEPGAASSPTAESAAAKQKRLASQERALFSGQGGATSAGLTANSQQT
jgi:hypothetical protein